MRRKIILFMCIAYSSVIYAYSDSTAVENSGILSAKRRQPAIAVRQYRDSLKTLRQRLLAPNGAQGGANDFASQDIELNVLTSPLTFYHGVADRLFGLAGTASQRSSIDLSLMKMYIKHPEWVIDSERTLSEEGGIAYKPSEPVVNDEEMTAHAEEAAIPKAQTGITDPVTLVTVRPNFWTYAGDYSLQFLQNYVSDNWHKGGESNYSMIGAVVFQANYNDKEKIKWDNKLEMKLGMQSSQGDTLHNYKSSEDLIRLTSKLGIQATKKWYYTLQAIASTQFTHGYKANDRTVYSDFMSPLNVNLSLGMDYKLEWFNKRLAGTVNISPLAGNFKYVDRLALSKKYGIDEGCHSLWDIGSTFTTDLTWTISELIKWQTRLYAYTTYHRAEVEWENTVTFQLSKYISTKVFVYPRFDDSTKKRDSKYGYFQLKEYWSLGFNYSF